MKPRSPNKKSDDKGGETIHAEQDAIKKLKPLNHKKPKKVSIIIAQFNLKLTPLESKPCIKCMSALSNYLPKKGYILEYIYYTGSDHKLHKTTLKNMIESNLFFVSLYMSRLLEKKKENYDIQKLKIVKKLILSIKKKK
jgi:hypothetical protein